MARISFYQGEEHLLDVPLHGRLVIGRSDACDLVVPGDAVSRTHCVIHAELGRWILTDRSRHGTAVDGQRIEGRVELADGSKIQLGGYTLRFRASSARTPMTATRPLAQEPAEQLLSTEGGLAVQGLDLVILEGPDAGLRFPLRRSLTTVGGPGSDVALTDIKLRQHHLRIRAPRGRPLLLPGPGPALLGGERVREAIPVEPGEPVQIGDTVLCLQTRQEELSEAPERFGAMVADSSAMRQLFGYLQRVADRDFPLLVVGESGTGKELIARAVHENGPRADGPFVAINCAALPAELIEAELFGHEKGAFTGATSRRDGAFQSADRGTLVLDELGEMPLEMQAKLLRALESGEVRRVGSFEVEYPDVRVIALTNRDLEGAVNEGAFRQDLFFRLAVLALSVPPLRSRLEDVRPIAEAICASMRQPARLTPEALERLMSHHYPGNARELRNILLRATTLAPGPVIPADAILFSPWAFSDPQPTLVRDSADQRERALLLRVLNRHQWNQTAAASELGVARSTLRYKVKRLGIKPPGG